MTMNTMIAISRRGLVRGLLVGAALVVLAAGTLRPASAGSDDPAQFVRDLSGRAIGGLADESLTGDERRQAFRRLLIEGFDVKVIGRFVLGRYWRKASEAERAEYNELFEDMIVSTYSRQLEAYGGETLKVEGVRQKDDKSVTVASRILRPKGEPILLDWRLLRRGDRWQVVDLVVEGMSMALTQRSEFAAVIRAEGGRVAGLIEKLREKVARSKALEQQEADSGS